MEVKKREYAEADDNSYITPASTEFHKRMKINNDHNEDFGGETESGAPSAVVHCRGLPVNVSEAELTALLSPYGKVDSVCILNRGQALIEMDSIQSSSTIIATSTSSNPILYKNQKIFFSYSKSQHLNSKKNQNSPPASNILLCSILNPLYPITTQTLYTIMSPYGRVLRIVIFQKKVLQAFVEFEATYSAWMAKEGLNGQDIYTGSCTLQIDFARVTKLNVKQNDEKTADYTMPSEFQMGMVPSAFPYAGAGPFSGHPGGIDINNNAPYGKNPYAMMGMPSGTPQPMFMGFQHPHHPHHLPNGMPMAMSGAAGPHMVGSETLAQAVIMIHKLPEQVTSDNLFNLFCLYGSVIKIKMLSGTKTGSMIQMADGIQAETAINCLNNANVYGQKIKVFPSRQPAIADSDKTKDYAESPLNRFNRKGLGNYKNIFKPSSTLHFLNVPITFTEKDLIHLFINSGASAPNLVKFFPTQTTKQMGLMEFPDVKTATEALMIVNNTSLDGNVLKLSFTSNSIHKTDDRSKPPMIGL